MIWPAQLWCSGVSVLNPCGTLQGPQKMPGLGSRDLVGKTAGEGTAGIRHLPVEPHLLRRHPENLHRIPAAKQASTAGSPFEFAFRDAVMTHSVKLFGARPLV